MAAGERCGALRCIAVVRTGGRGAQEGMRLGERDADGRAGRVSLAGDASGGCSDQPYVQLKSIAGARMQDYCRDETPGSKRPTSKMANVAGPGYGVTGCADGGEWSESREQRAKARPKHSPPSKEVAMRLFPSRRLSALAGQFTARSGHAPAYDRDRDP